MLKRIVTAAVLIAVVSSAVAPANAQVDPQKVNNRKQVIHGCLLNIYLAQKKRPQALAEYAILVGMNPTDSKMRYNYGVYILQGNTPADYNAALIQLKKAVELEPGGNFEYYGTIGAIYTKLKNPDEALKWYGQAIQYGGGEKYKKLYQDLQTYMQQKRQFDLQKKQQLQQKKLQEQQKKKQQNPDGTKKDSDDDDDW